MAEQEARHGVDYYRELGVSQTANSDDIRASYKRLAKLWHPDHHHSSEDDRRRSEEMMKRISLAYRVLSDISRRDEYDSRTDEEREDDSSSSDSIPLGWRSHDSAKFEGQMRLWEQETDKFSSLSPHPLGRTEGAEKFRDGVRRLMSTHFPEQVTRRSVSSATSQDTSSFSRFNGEQDSDWLHKSGNSASKISSGTQSSKFVEPESESKSPQESFEVFVNSIVSAVKANGILESDFTTCHPYEQEMSGQVQVGWSGKSCSKAPEVKAGSKINFSSAILSSHESPVCVVAAPTPWVPVSERVNCVGCSRKFFSFAIRHNCRSCGEVFCANCTSRWITLRRYGFTSPVRVCNSCFQNHVFEYINTWLDHGKALARNGHFQKSWSSFVVAVALQAPDDRASIIMEAFRAFQGTEKLHWAVYWCAVFLDKLPRNSSASLKMHRALAGFLYNCAMNAKETDDRLCLLNTALGAEYRMQDIARQAIPRLDYFSDFEQKVRTEIGKTEEERKTLYKKTLESAVSKLRSALSKYDMKLFAAELCNSDRTIVNMFMKETESKTHPKHVNSWNLLALVLCRLRMQPDDCETLDVLDTAIWSGFGTLQHEQVVRWAIELTIGAVEEGKWQWVQHTRIKMMTRDVMSKTCIGVPEPPSVQHWSSMSIKGLKVRHIRKYEIAVGKKVATKEWSPRRAALAYIDLRSSCEHPAQIAICSLIISLWLLSELKAVVESGQAYPPNQGAPTNVTTQKQKQLRHVYSLKRGISEWLQQAILVSELFLHPVMQLHIARQAFRCSSAACLLAGQNDPSDSVETYFDIVVRLARLCPVSDFSRKGDSILVSEAVVFDVLTRDLHVPFLSDLQLVEPEILSPVVKQSQINYQLFESGMNGLCQVEPTVRETAMDELLREQGWSWEDVESLTNSPRIPRDAFGWLITAPRSLAAVKDGFSEVLGLAIYKQTGELKLIARSATHRNGLVTLNDLREAFQANSNGFGSLFSLDPPDNRSMRYHPFQKMVYQPHSLQGTEILHTLLHTDYLLKQFSTGIEVSSVPPFEQRVSQLTSSLSRALQHALRPVHERTGSISMSHVHRFWIKAKQMNYNITEDEDCVYYLVGDVTMEVCCRPMMPDTDGELHDIADEEDKGTAEFQFASDFTERYSDVGRAFPEFLRLKEICKLLWLGSMAHSHAEMLRRHAHSPDVPDELVEKVVAAQESDCLSKVNSMLSDITKQLRFLHSNERKRVGRTVKEQIEQSIGFDVDQILFDDWIANPYNSSSLARSIAAKLMPSRSRIRQILVDRHKQTFRQQEQQYRDRLMQLRPQIGPKEGDCCWVPAAHYRFTEAEGVSRQIYGGVILQPKLRQTSLLMPSLRDVHPLRQRNPRKRPVASTELTQFNRELRRFRPNHNCYLPVMRNMQQSRRSHQPAASAGGTSSCGGVQSSNNGDGNDDAIYKHDPRFLDTGKVWTKADTSLPRPISKDLAESFKDEEFRMVVSRGCILGRLHDSRKYFSKYGRFWVFMSDEVVASDKYREGLAVQKEWNDLRRRNVIYVPEGIRMLVGKTAPQGKLPGGKLQLLIPDEDIVRCVSRMNENAARGRWNPAQRNCRQAFDAQKRYYRSEGKRARNLHDYQFDYKNLTKSDVANAVDRFYWPGINAKKTFDGVIKGLGRTFYDDIVAMRITEDLPASSLPEQNKEES